MEKGLKQPKHENQALEMARQALGRVKELDLTPEQKEEVMEKIEQAQTAEKAGNIGKAITYYQGLKNLIDHWQKEKISTDKQFKKIKELVGNTNKDYADNSLIRNNILKKLEDQKIIITLPEKSKVQIIANEDFQARESDGPIQSEQTVMYKFYEFCPEIDPEDLFVMRKVINKQGYLIKLELGIIGGLDYHYEYAVGGFPGPLHTIITKRISGKSICIAQYRDGQWEKEKNEDDEGV